jgi:UDP-N-acetylmuramate dehydrogenase
MESTSSAATRAVALAGLTTLRLGGPARRLVQARTEAELVDAVRAADADGEPLLVLAGGSNVVIADAGWPGVVVHILTRGIEERREGAHTSVEAQAGEPWDPFVERCVRGGLSGLECLSGIPGSVGATPIQNVGAYGQEVSDVIASVRVLDRETGAVRRLPRAECGFAYRTSRFRGSQRWVVLAVEFELERSDASAPIRYSELARALGVEPGRTAPLQDAREAVLALRRGKGMVVDDSHRESVSAGSFFTNPILDREAFAALEARVAERLGADARLPGFPEPDGRVKTSAAWLIERAGFARGYGDGAAGISGKHTLALVNRGGATTAELLEVAREIAAGVRDSFGVELRPEPVFVGHAWDDSAA